MDRKYRVILEQADDGSYSAYVPDLPGCVACADLEALRRSIKSGYVEAPAA